jgi:hypothetical protein
MPHILAPPGKNKYKAIADVIASKVVMRNRNMAAEPELYPADSQIHSHRFRPLV